MAQSFRVLELESGYLTMLYSNTGFRVQNQGGRIVQFHHSLSMHFVKVSNSDLLVIASSICIEY